MSPRNAWERSWFALRRGPRIQQAAVAVATAVVICIVIRGWDPPFTYRTDFSLERDVVAGVRFDFRSARATFDAERRALWSVPHVFELDATPLTEARQSLRNELLGVLNEPASELPELEDERWAAFFTQIELEEMSVEDRRIEYQTLQREVKGDDKLTVFEQRLAAALAPFEERGLLKRLGYSVNDGAQDEIVVYPKGSPDDRKTVKVADVLIGDGAAIRESLRMQFGSDEVADRALAWLQPRLTNTLHEDEAATAKAKADARAAVGEVTQVYERGQTLVRSDHPLGPEDIQLLRAEHAAALAERSLGERFLRATGVVLLILGLFALAGIFVAHHERPLRRDVSRLIQLAVLMVVCVLLVEVLRRVLPTAGRVELVPILLFAQITAVAYTRELAMLLTAIASFIVVLALGAGIDELTILMGTAGAAILQLTRIRARSKLIRVGVASGAAAVVLTLVIDVLWSQTLTPVLITRALINGLWTIAAGFLMTGLLPFIERPFGVLTDVSLLELTDVSHPLLHELVRRAPATYAHSILVGSIAERAAEAIGARGLLVRVGAYFHDIGKILKPAYYYENQAPDENRHATLVPQMSTLVIIAHVKDGVDLARQHRLPQPIIDLIEQHHGTTLVQYFFGLANEQQRQADPESNGVEESTYRYPGPRPRTKEAGILMLADASESACRSLSEPSPQRIEGLVRNVAKEKLQDGQFDDSGLTLKEIRTIEDSIIKSLIANYHGRIKYPSNKEVESPVAAAR